MADIKRRTAAGVYKALGELSDETGIDFGVQDYTQEEFEKKYFTGPGNIENLYHTLNAIGEEANLDFGQGTRDEWLASFGYKRTREDAREYSTLDGRRIGGSQLPADQVERRVQTAHVPQPDERIEATHVDKDGNVLQTDTTQLVRGKVATVEIGTPQFTPPSSHEGEELARRNGYYNTKESLDDSFSYRPNEYGEMRYGWQRGQRIKQLNRTGLEFMNRTGAYDENYDQAASQAEKMSDAQLVAEFNKLSGQIADAEALAGTADGYAMATVLRAYSHELRARDIGFAHGSENKKGIGQYQAAKQDPAVAAEILKQEAMSPEQRKAYLANAYKHIMAGEEGAPDIAMLAGTMIHAKESGIFPEEAYSQVVGIINNEHAEDVLAGALQSADAEIERLSQLIEQRTQQLYAEDEAEGMSLAKVMQHAESGSGAPIFNQRLLNDPELSMLWTAKRAAERRKKVIERKQDNHGFMRQFIGTFWDTATDINTWDFGIQDMRDAVNLVSFGNNKGSNAPMERAREAMLQNTVDAQEAEQRWRLSAAQRWGIIGGQALPFVAEFIGTGGGFSGVRQGVTKGVTSFLEKSLGKAASSKAAQWLVRSTGMLTGDIASALLMANTTGSMKTYADILDRKTGDLMQLYDGTFVFRNSTTMGDAILKGEVANTLEYYTEMLGNHLDGLISGAGKRLGLSRLSEGMKWLTGRQIQQLTTNVLRQGGINELPSEILEEEANLILNAMLVGDNNFSTGPLKELANKFGCNFEVDPNSEDYQRSIFNPETQADIWGGMLFSIGAMRAPSVAIGTAGQGWNTANYYYYKHKTDVAGTKLYGLVGGDELLDRINNTTNEQIPSLVAGILADDDFTPDMKSLAMDYIGNLVKERGYNVRMFDNAKDLDPEQDQEEGETIDLSYQEGYNASDEEQAGVKERVDVARAWLYNLGFDDSNIASLDSEEIPEAWLDALDDEQRAAVEEYRNAMAAYDGMLQHVQDDVDTAIAESEATVEQRTHPDTGAVHRAELKTGGEVFIISGNVALMPDNSIDIENSDGDLIVLDPATGGKRMIHVSDLASADEPVMADQLKQEAAATIQEAMATEAANRIDGVLPFQPGDVYSDLPFGDETHTVQVIADGEDGVNVVVSIDGGEQTLMPMQMIQEAADAQREARIAEQAAVAGTAAQPQPTGQEDVPTEEPAEEVPADNEASQGDAIPEHEAVEEEQPDEDAMPMNGDEVDWFATSPERGHRFLYEEAGLSPEEADAVVANSVKDAEKELEKVSKKAPKPGNAAQLNKYRAEKAAHEQQVAAAQAALDYWKGVQATQQQVVADLVRRQADERAAQDAAERQAAIEAEEQYQAEQAAKQQEQAERGPGVVGQNIIEKWSAAPKVVGRADVKTLQDGSTVSGHYVMHEDGAMTPSHDPFNGWSPSDGFPTNEAGGTANQRDYHGDKNAQTVTQAISNPFDGRAYQDPPVGSNEGITYSGNGRTIAGMIAARNNTDGPYLETMRQYPEKYGFTAEDVAKFQHPRVTFVLDERLPYTPEVFGLFNAQDTKGMSNTETAVALGKTVDDVTFNDVVGLINQFDTMGKFYEDDTAPTEAITLLLRGGVITPMQHAQMFDGDKVSAQGKEILENLLLGKAFEGNPNAIRQLMDMPSVRRQVVVALAEIANNSRLGQFSLEDLLSQSIDLVYKARNAKNKVKQGESVLAYAKQLSLFPGITGSATVADINNTAMVMIADILNDHGTNTLKYVLTMYNYSAGEAIGMAGSLFIDESPEGILQSTVEHINKLSNNELKQEINAAVEQRKAAAQREAGSGQEAADAGAGSNAAAKGPAARQGDLAQAEVSAPLSDEVNEFGVPFVLSSDGTTTFGEVTVDSGLKAAPIKLSLGENSVDDEGINHGYGYLHIDAGHGQQILSPETGFKSIEEFVETVARNYDTIREGNQVAGNQTYLLELSDEHNNTLFIQLSHDGSYWNVNSAGIFRKKYSRRMREVASLLTIGNSSSTETVEVNRGQKDGATATSENSSLTSEGKGSTENANVQGNSEKNVDQSVAKAEAEVDTEPTDGQKEAGNYKKGHVKIDGFDVTIEQPKGSVRSGVDASGKEWSQEMHNTYGYIRGTEGVDGDHIDVFLSDHLDNWNGMVYVVDQVNKDGTFDEHKVMYGFNSEQEARDAYLSNYEEGWTGLGTITGVTREEFKKWVDSSHRKTKPFAEYKSVRATGSQYTDNTSRPIQGLEDYSEEEILRYVREFFDMIREDNDADAEIVDVRIIGSRARGDADVDSDLDILLEYRGSEREDDMFTMLNGGADGMDDTLTIGGIDVDINPIRADYSGTIDEWIEDHKDYRKEEKRAATAEATEPVQSSGTEDQADVAGMLAEEFKDEIEKSASKIEIVPESAEDGPVEAVANVTVDGQPSNIWLAIGEGRTIDEHWKRVCIHFLDSEWQEIGDLADAYNEARGKEVCRDDEDAKRINFDSIDDAVDFEHWRAENQENLSKKGVKREEVTESISKTEGNLSKTSNGGKVAGKSVGDVGKNRIDDFGEKIGGARKDVARGRIRDAKKMSVKDLTTLKKGADDILSQANILRLYKDGQMDEVTARQFMALNNVIKSVLSSGLLKNIRGIALEKYRDAAVAWEEGKPFSLEITDKDIQAYKLTRPNASDERARESLVYHITDPVSMHLATYEALNYPAEERKLGRYVIVDYSKMQSDHVTLRRHIWVKNGYSAHRGYPFDNLKDAVTKMKALCPVVEAKAKKARGEKAEHGLHVTKEGYGYYIKSRNIPGNIYLSPRFSTEKQAKEYLENNLDRLKEREQRLVDALMGSNIGMAEREGVDYRNGKDVTPQDFLDEFGFRGVEFGNWVPQGERQMYLNKTYDAIKDFCAIVGISPKAFSLGGRLGLAFGARGHSRAMAHYEPAKEVINLTRMSGVGSLAHEWFHAVDNYLAKQKTGNMSDMATVTHDVVRDELSRVFKDMYDAMRSMDYHRRSRNAGEYWGRTEEEFARLFENYIYNKLAAKETTSPVLVRKDVLLDDVEEQMKSSWPYPSAEENAKMEPYFDRLFDTIQEKTDDNGNVVLFQKAEGSTISKDAAEREAAMRDALVELLRGAGIEVVTDAEEGQRVLDAVNGRVQAMGFANSREEFDNTRDRAVAETGIVMTGLAEEEVTVVDVPRHDFTGVAPIKQAEAWGKKNLVTPKDKKGNYIDKPKLKDGTEYSISSNAVGKFLSKSATKNSDNLGVHLSVLKKLKDVIHESMEAEVHPDYKKDETGKRDPRNGYNPDYLVHRLYGAVDIDGKIYRVKTTIIENGNESRNYPHSYEVTEIEMLDDSMAGSESRSVNIGREGHDTKNRLSNNSIAGAKLLQGVEKSYDPGKKLLDESEKSTESGVNLHRVWHGSGAEFDTFDHSHMGEGEGAQAYGWGTYVTEVEDIGRRYAEGSAKKHPYLNTAKRRRNTAQENLINSRNAAESCRRDIASYEKRIAENEDYIRELEQTRKSLVEAHGEESVEVKNWDFLGQDMLSQVRQESETDKSRLAGTRNYLQNLEAMLPYLQSEYETAEAVVQRYEAMTERYLYEVEIPEEAGAVYLDHVALMKDQPDVLESVDNALTAQGWRRQEIDDTPVFTKGEKKIILSDGLSGGELYLVLEGGLGSDRAASEFLHEAGVTGIVYPSNYLGGGNRMGSKNYVIFDEADAKIIGKEKFFRTADGTAYGFVRDGKIYIDPRIATSETPIHEFTHLWCAALRRVNPEAWARLKEALLGQKDVLEHVKRLYPELEGDELMDEVFAHYSGRRGRERLQREQEREVAKAKGIFDKARVVAVFDRIRRALDNFWLAARHLFAGKVEGIDKLSAEDFADMAMVDLMRGFNPTEEVRKLDADGRKAAQLRLVTEANAMTDTYHTGIRRIDDIKTYEEAVAEGEGIGSYPDFTEEDARAALDRGHATVYSSHPIEPGSFVSMSRMEAEEYAGGGEVYSQEVPLEDVAWIYANEGQYAPVGDGGGAAAHGTRTQRTAPTFYSNAERAVEGVKQGKAKAEQWKAMLTKAGGIKAGEDKWMGLSQWLDEHKGETLTKDEVLQFVRDNGIRMEENIYGELQLKSLQQEFDEIYDNIINRVDGEDTVTFPKQEAWDELRSRYHGGDDFDMAFSLDNRMRIQVDDEDRAGYFLGTNPINMTRLDYTTEGLENKREIAFVVPDVEPYQEDDEIHFGPENQGRAVMWVRFGEATDTDGNRVLVIDEIQSNRHQDAREGGYRPREVYELRRKRDELKPRLKELSSRLQGEGITEEEIAEYRRLGDEDYRLKNQIIELITSSNGSIPAAPFEKNWHEVAMKRMLRLAAEEGFDKVAWTTGGQQAERYDIGKRVDKIEVHDLYDGLHEVQGFKDGKAVFSQETENGEQGLAELLGKEMARKAYSNLHEGETDYTDEKGRVNFTGDNLQIGGEGMKGFYDQMLPRFMDKYGKRWGVKTGEVTLATPGQEVMHSVDVTPEMRRSVLEQGQPLFQKSGEGGLEAINERFNERLDELDADPNQKDRVLHLGHPGEFLLSGGIVDAEIQMEYDLFVRKSKKSYKNDHPLTKDDIKDLPKAINAPIAVFNSTTAGDKVILTELKKGEHNFIVAIRAITLKKKGGVVLKLNEIESLYPKKERGIVNWINNRRLTVVDKEKALQWISALRPHAETEELIRELDDAAKVVKEFVNPTVESEKSDSRDAAAVVRANSAQYTDNAEARLREALVEGGRLAIINQGGKWRIEGMPGEFGSRNAAIDEWRERAAGNVVWYLSEDGNYIEVEGNGGHAGDVVAFGEEFGVRRTEIGA